MIIRYYIKKNSSESRDVWDNHLFADLSLTLKDDNNEITPHVHKLILYSHCIYLEKLLTNCKEKFKYQIL